MTLSNENYLIQDRPARGGYAMNDPTRDRMSELDELRRALKETVLNPESLVGRPNAYWSAHRVTLRDGSKWHGARRHGGYRPQSPLTSTPAMDKG